MEGQSVIRISVRNLVEFILREGDIDNRSTGGMNAEAMQIGSRIHRKIQRSMGSEYQSEVYLKYQKELSGFCLRVEGRADGIFKEKQQVFVDEIKGTFSDLEKMKEPVGVHLAQAKCYAYIYGVQNSEKLVGVQMTYCHMDTEEIKRFRYYYSIQELKEWFESVIGAYEKWAEFLTKWRQKRNLSIKRIQFPFEYREGQKELAQAVYRTILRKKNLFIQAPTGVGKTISTVFPAVKAVGEELGDRIFYLTAKTITRTVAEQAFEILREQGLQYKVITLTAKEKLCFLNQQECNPESCPYAKGHYDRVNDAVYELLVSADEMSRERVEEQAKKHQVCPFEMALDLALWVDAVICDYNYVFDPNVHLKRFFSENNNGNYLFLVDEAHNLVERGRTMYSAEIYKEELVALKKVVREESPRLYRRLESCNQSLLQLKKECDTCQVLTNISSVYLKLLNVMSEMERYMESNPKKEIKDAVMELYFPIRHFLSTYENLDDKYVIYAEMVEDGRFMLKLFCVDPSTQLQKYLDMGNSTIFFSATFLPIQYYKKLLSDETDNYAIYANSFFDIRNRFLASGTDVSTKYTKRSKEMYRRYAEYILCVMKVKKGNYLAFFPSYKFMEAVYEEFQERQQESGEYNTCVIQTQYMNEAEREEFLGSFEAEREESLIGFCVLGGIFSEGIDLAKERLIGAFIVGTGIPQVCSEREILRQYFEEKEGRGFAYAYLYPGMNKVLQAAGRVIRTEEDKGTILLLDERFDERQYREIFPREWADCKSCSLRDIQNKLNRFWKIV